MNEFVHSCYYWALMAEISIGELDVYKRKDGDWIVVIFTSQRTIPIQDAISEIQKEKADEKMGK